MTNTILNLDMDRVRKMMANCKQERHPALKNPNLDPDSYIQSLVDQYEADYPSGLTQQKLELSATKLKITDIESKISKLKEKKSIDTQKAEREKIELQGKIAQILAFFPERQHDIIRNHLNNNNIKSILNRLRTNTNFLAKIFTIKSKEQEITKLHTEIQELMRSADTLKTNIGQTDQKINDLTNSLSNLRKKLTETPRFQERHEEILTNLHQAVADFLYAYENRTELRKHIPPTLNMQGLTEPVAFFQTITNTTKQELENLLKHAGLKTGYKPDEYIIRETHNLYGDKCLELITPFYSPESARKNIETIIKYLSEHGVKFTGVIKPATYSQINPTPTKPIEHTETNEGRIKALITKQLKSGISIEEFENIYQQESKESPQNREYIFRGQTFASSDPASSYATPTWRPGRTGIVYGTPDARTSVSYATNLGNNNINGLTMNTEHMLKVGDHIVGLVTVFKNSPRNLWLSDRNLEDIDDKKSLRDMCHAKKTVEETIISPANNPIAARYLAVGKKLVKIDDNPEWNEILNYMAPNMQTTHIYGINGTEKTNHHGRQFLERLTALAGQYADQNTVTAYDISEDILKKMGYSPTNIQKQKLPQLQLQHGADRIME